MKNLLFYAVEKFWDCVADVLIAHIDDAAKDAEIEKLKAENKRLRLRPVSFETY